MTPASDRVIRALEALGGIAPTEHVRAHVEWAHGPGSVRHAVAFAVLRGAVEHVDLDDGRPGLRLVADRQAVQA